MEPNINKFSFIGAALSLVVTFLASGAPIPLYGIYQAVDGITYFELSLSSVVYFVGAVSALLFFGRLSNHYGRKTISLLTLLFAAIATASFLNVHSAIPLLVGRLAQGIASGLASTALAAWVVDHADAVPSWVAPAVISCGPMTGLTIGGIGAGILVEYAPMPRQFSFYIVLVLLALSALFICFSTETMEKHSGALRSLKPHFALPPKARAAFPVAAVTFVCTWSLGGFFQAFGPAIAKTQLNSPSAVAAAFVFASIMAPSSLGASIAGKTTPKKAQRFFMLGFTVFVLGLLVCMKLGVLLPYLIMSVLAGIAQGGVLSGSIQSMVQGLAKEQRANVLSVIYVTSYIGAAVPTLIAGHYSESFSLFQVACGYGALAILGSIVVIIAKVRQGKAKTALSEG